MGVPQGEDLGHTERQVRFVVGETLPARLAPYKETSTFSKEQREEALRLQVEMLVAWARELLDPTPDVIDGPMIRQRRVEAARAILDVLWATMARYDTLEGELHPVPGLIAHKFPSELRHRTHRARRSVS
jgi:hypothetical protein